MVFSCCVSGSTAAVHTGDAGSRPRVQVPLQAIFFRSIVFNAHYIVKVANTEIQDINQFMSYRDA